MNIAFPKTRMFFLMIFRKKWLLVFLTSQDSAEIDIPHLFHAIQDFPISGKSPDFFPTPLLVRTSFGGHSKSSFLFRMTQKDPRTRKVVRTTGMKKGMTVNLRSFDLPSSPFGPPFSKTDGRSDHVPVIPSKEDPQSFPLVLKQNEPATTTFIIPGSFHQKSCVRSCIIKWHQNDKRMMLEWWK